MPGILGWYAWSRSSSIIFKKTARKCIFSYIDEFDDELRRAYEPPLGSTRFYRDRMRNLFERNIILGQIGDLGYNPYY